MVKTFKLEGTYVVMIILGNYLFQITFANVRKMQAYTEKMETYNKMYSDIENEMKKQL